MKRILSTAAALLLYCFVFYGQTSTKMNYEKQWQQVSTFEKKSLPKSAAAEVNTILRQAIADKNSPQVIKALIHQGKYDLAIDAENDTAIFHNLKQMLEKSTDIIEKSVLHSMLGELYLHYYQKDSWKINQRTALGDFVPADMKEWTQHIFYDKAVEHLNASLQAQTPLEKAQVQSYAAVVELGTDSRRFYPTIYDFLALRAIDFLSKISQNEGLSRSLAKKGIAQEALFSVGDEFVKLPFNPQPKEYNLRALETYRKLITSLENRKLSQSSVLVQLDKIDYLSRLSGAKQKYALKSLQKLLDQYKNDPISVEIVDKMGDFYSISNYLEDEQKTEQAQKLTEYYELLQKTINAFSKYERTSLLRNKLSQLTQPQLSASGNNTFAPESDKKITIYYKNLAKITVKLYRLKDALSSVNRRVNTQKEEKQFVKEFQVPLLPKAPYLQSSAEVNLDVAQQGFYKLEFETDKQFEKDNNNSDYYFSVTNLAAFARLSGQNKHEIFVVNRQSGNPMTSARVKIYEVVGNWRNSSVVLITTLPVNQLGLAVYAAKQNNRSIYYQPVANSDNHAPLTRLPNRYYQFSETTDETRQTVNIYTDRSIYRPGQTVYFKAIAVNTQGDKSEVITGKSFDFSLRDANYQEVSKQTLTTNEFGAVSGEFVLPQNLLSGNFSIHNSQGSIGFKVEEYKRPTFEISFDKIEKTYKFGEEVTLKGKAENYSGIKLQNADIAYVITRQQPWWWRWGGGSSAEQFAEGIAKTDENGQFEIHFTPQKEDNAVFGHSAYIFEVEASITDVNGETQTGAYSVAVGDKSMIISVEMPDQLEKSSEEKIVFGAKSLDGNEIKATGTYRIFSLHKNDSIHQQVAQGNFETGEQPAFKLQLTKFPSGKYRVKLQAKDDRGNKVEAEKDVILFSYDDKRPPITTNDWFVVKNKMFSADKNAEILLGATDNVHVMYELWQKNNLLERKWITINNENRLFSLPYKATYKDGVQAMFSFVKDEKFYHHAVDMLPEKEKKELTVKLDVFRDKIRPGSDEQWRISIKDAKGNPAFAEVLASMYDFSLDQIYAGSNWQLTLPNFGKSFYWLRLQNDASFGNESANGYFPLKMNPTKDFSFDQFNWYDFSFYHQGRRIMIRGLSSKNKFRSAVAVPEMFAAKETAQLDEVVTVGFGKEEKAEQDAAKNLNQSNEVDIAPQIRRNFNETAFFFPQLRTNEKGETQIAFRVPDSNTKWRFRVLAHDKNLNVGQAEAFTVSQKELMVTPNMPRFLRQGDKASISTKISNLSDGAIDGTVRIEFFDIVTEKTIENISVENSSKPFSLAEDASSDAAWTFDVPSDIELIGVRVIAQSASFSDGEQHALAVLPNRMLVTESMRMDVNGNQTKDFSMNRLAENSSPTAQNYRLTLEFTSNPAWYAVQALPVLSASESDNAVSWFAAYYANTLGMHISKAYPKVSAMIIMWKLKGGTSETLLSNLEKNQELKNVLLEETPWVLEAKNESEQKQKLALLFDLNRNQNLTRSAIEKLKELQTAQGGWSWFKGFYPSRSISQYILYGFNQLKALKAVEFTDEIRGMQAKAINYIDSEALRNFEQLKKYNKDWRSLKTIPVPDLEYLYVRSTYTQYPQDAKIKEMTAFYTSVIEKNWTQFSLYERSLIVLLMQRGGKIAIVQDILKSYREHATVSDEMGMFWANNRAHVFMSQSATSVHTFIMNAFRIGGASATEMDNLKRWLLKQKQTQLWESTHATMDAVYALLSSGRDWFSEGNKTKVFIGGKAIEAAQTELGTGYFKELWSKSEITPQMAHVKIENSGNAPAWGALYWQYYEALDKISKIDAALDVEKRLFKEQTDASGRNLVPITENSPLRVGDKVVVRLTVRTDRNLEFVHLKDMRAAAFEPVEQLSGTKWQGGTIYYQTSKDASTNFYFDTLPRGTYVFEYGVSVTRTGSYSNGITTIQCMYASEFTSHTAGIKINVK